MGNEGGNGSGDPEGGQEAEDDVLTRVVLGQVEGLIDCAVKARIPDRQEVQAGEDAYVDEEPFQLLALLSIHGRIRLVGCSRCGPWRPESAWWFGGSW